MEDSLGLADVAVSQSTLEQIFNSFEMQIQLHNQYNRIKIEIVKAF